MPHSTLGPPCCTTPQVKHSSSPAPCSKIFNNERILKTFNPISFLLVEKLFLPYILAFSIFLTLHIRHFYYCFIQSISVAIYPHFKFLLLFILSWISHIHSRILSFFLVYFRQHFSEIFLFCSKHSIFLCLKKCFEACFLEFYNIHNFIFSYIP